MNRERRISLVAEIVDARAELAQSVDEIADRALVHAGQTGELVFAARERENCRQRPERRARVAEEQLSTARRNLAAHTLYDDGRLIRRYLETELAQGFDHVAGVVGVEQIED